MAETVLAIAEQHSGQLNRVSLETVAAAQAIAQQMGWQVEVAVLGSGIAAVAQQLAAFQAAKVYALESPQLARYTADAYTHALRSFLSTHTPQLILLPHIVVDEAVHRRRRAPGLSAEAKELHVDVVPEFARIRIGNRHGIPVEFAAVPHRDLASALQRIAFRALESVEFRIARIEPPQHAVEGAVLQHQHHDVLDLSAKIAHASLLRF